MDINELLIPVEPSSGSTNGSPEGAQPQAVPAAEPDSQYRQALSRSLQTTPDSEPTTVADGNGVPASFPADGHNGSTNGEPAAATSALSAAAEPSVVAAEAAAATQVHIVAAPTAVPDLTGNEAVDPVETIEVTQPQALPETPEETAAAETIVVLTSEVPVPPADISSLFVAADAGGRAEAIVSESTDQQPGSESPTPPKSLFEAAATVESPASDASLPESNDTPDRAESDTSILISGVDAISRSSTKLFTEPNVAGAQPRQQKPEPRPEIETAPSVGEERAATSDGSNAAVKIESKAANAFADPPPAYRATSETVPPIRELPDVPQQAAAATETEAARPKTSDRPRREDPAQDNSLLARQPVVAVDRGKALEPLSNPIRSEAAAESRTPLDSTVAGPKPVPQNRSEPLPSSATPPAGQGLSPSTTPTEAGPVVPSTGTADADPERLIERAAAAIRSATPGGRQLRIRLSPPHLGPLDIAVTSRDQMLSVRLEVQTQSAHGALVDNLAMLRDALAQQGTAVERIDVQLVEPAAEEGASDFENGQQQTDSQTGKRESQQRADEQNGEETEEQESVPVADRGDAEELDIQV